MERLKRFFRIDSAYRFEYGDFSALMTVLNVALLIFVGTIGAWVGLANATTNMGYALRSNRKINLVVTYGALFVLNLYYITV